METKQPVWKYVGHIGDVDPISYGGGFVYVDETNVYGPELTYFAPSDDSVWDKAEDKDAVPVTVYRILLESGPQEWFYDTLSDIASYTGRDLANVQADATSNDPLILANLFFDMISYFGAYEFDQDPVVMTELEANTKYANELQKARTR